MEPSLTLINDFQLVTNGTKNSMLDATVILYIKTYWAMYNADYLN